ncbi:ComEC/Rec2 family competence protein [Altererythrobacter sp. MF3-039]|uniref:ComEC/Rec2 family competence protein n=1 Tax=Altererythrobacter sp. MF3-039 TaxID=3252901 RepID=UPI00390CB9FB
MASKSGSQVPYGNEPDTGHAAVQHSWRTGVHLSSFAARANDFLLQAGFDRGPWLAVALAGGIAIWFLLASPWQWMALIAGCILAAIGALSLHQSATSFGELRAAFVSISLAIALGVMVIWARSAMVGAEPYDFPRVERFEARILDREEEPARDRVRLTLAMRDAEAGKARKVRVNVPLDADRPHFREGAIIRLRARLMPPAPPMLPGAYDFARAAWFKGLSATGTVLGPIELTRASEDESWLAQVQRRLSHHVREQMSGSPASIAAAFASGDRGAISDADEEAMRDSGLTHLLSISGLHVSAVIAAAYLLSIKILALWPWLALRLRLPVVAAATGALAGIGYTLLTGSEVPTVRSCAAAVLVLIALAMGREPLSMRMVAVAAAFVLLVWPESLVGPSFQMSFAAVLSIIALHNTGWVREFLAPREEGWLAKIGRRGLMLLLTGLVIELVLMPIVLFHFHRGGFYGALANVIAIPLVTFVSMPLIAIGLLLDLVGAGAPAWWLVQQSLELLVGIARFTAKQPGAVKLLPQMGDFTFFLFLLGLLWLGLWQGKARLFGLAPVAIATAMLAVTPAPDVLISGDGRHVGIAGEDERLLVLRDGRSSFARDNLLELAGMDGEPITLEEWPMAQCSRDFCTLGIERNDRTWQILMARSRDRVEERALAAACIKADIVIADRWLPRSCQPKWLKADKRMLSRTGGLSLYLADERIDSVADGQGEHGWWKGRRD